MLADGVSLAQSIRFLTYVSPRRKCRRKKLKRGLWTRTTIYRLESTQKYPGNIGTIKNWGARRATAGLAFVIKKKKKKITK